MNLALMEFILEIPDNVKYGAYVINLDDYSDAGTHWIFLYAKNDNVTFFYFFGVELVPEKIYQ